MKAWSLRGTLLIGIVVILFGMALHAPLIVIGERLLPEWSSVIKAWKELLMLLVAVATLYALVKKGNISAFFSDWVVRIGVAYVALHILLAIIIPTELLPKIAGLMIDLRYVAFFLICYAVAWLYPEIKRRALGSVLAGAAVVVGFGALQILVLPDNALQSLGYGADTIRPFTTIDSNTDYVRINSTLRGPNPLGAICVLYLSLALAYLLKRRTWDVRSVWATIAAIGSIAVLFASYSRSAYIAAIVAAGLLCLFAFKKYLTPARIGIGAAVVGVGIIGLLQLRTTDWFSNVILHEDPESTVVTKSNDEHIASLVDGLDRKVSQPFGAGIGSTGSAVVYGEDSSGPTIENIYLFIAHESGWFGLGLFIALFVVLLKRLYQKRSEWLAIGLFVAGFGLALIGMLLPVWTDETVALSWWGLTGVILGSGYGTGTRKQKATRTP